MREYVAFDLETTGLSVEEDQVIEIGAVKVKNGKIAGKYNCIIYPEREVSDFIIRLTGITRKMLDGGIPMREGVEGFLAFSEGYPVLGHNLMFDYRFMKTAAKRFHYAFEKEGVDTLRAARLLLRGLESKKLSSLCEHYHYVNQAAHRAYDDALATAVVFESMKREFGEDQKVFVPEPLQYRPKKLQMITAKQKRYLNELRKYHKIEDNDSIDGLTMSEASRTIDEIISKYGVMR